MGLEKKRGQHNNGKRFLYSAGHSPFSPREIEIAEACAVIFSSATKFETITEPGAAIHTGNIRVAAPDKTPPACTGSCCRRFWFYAVPPLYDCLIMPIYQRHTAQGKTLHPPHLDETLNFILRKCGGSLTPLLKVRNRAEVSFRFCYGNDKR
jgi:hypothetical protein